MEDNPELSDDGLILPEVGRWAEDKHRLIGLYDQLFSTGMRAKWDQRIYIDLYSGAGLSRIRGSNRIIAGSPIIALTVDNPFDKYIFCEENEELLDALQKRVGRFAPQAQVSYIAGDCNTKVMDVCNEIPLASSQNRVLGLCLVDPFDLGVKFRTLQVLSRRYLDFICLLALHMDAKRNYSRYLSTDSKKIDEFLGADSWRSAWITEQYKPVQFPRFLAEQFSNRMQTLGYIPPPFYKMKEVRSNEKNLPLYHLALFSRSQRAYDFWDEVLKYSTDQTFLDF
jgi:three-Cys-motif partner protein